MQGRNLLSEEQLQGYETALFELQKWLEEQSIDLGNLSRIKWLVEAYQPEIVILECVEGNIPSVLSMLGTIDIK